MSEHKLNMSIEPEDMDDILNGPDSWLANTDKEAYRSFLIECMKENLNHARHIENERQTFLSLFLVVAGLFLGTIISPDTSHWLQLLLCVILLVFSHIMSQIFGRWNTVYKRHMNTAQRLARIVDMDGVDIVGARYCPVDWKPEEGHHPNYYYYFDNTVGKKALEDRGITEEKKTHWYSAWNPFKYTSTNQLFLRFCHLMTAIEIVLTVRAVLQILADFGVNIF